MPLASSSAKSYIKKKKRSHWVPFISQYWPLPWALPGLRQTPCLVTGQQRQLWGPAGACTGNCKGNRSGKCTGNCKGNCNGNSMGNRMRNHQVNWTGNHSGNCTRNHNGITLGIALRATSGIAMWITLGIAQLQQGCRGPTKTAASAAHLLGQQGWQAQRHHCIASEHLHPASCQCVSHLVQLSLSGIAGVVPSRLAHVQGLSDMEREALGGAFWLDDELKVLHDLILLQ